MKDQLEKAGLKSAPSELYVKATEALRHSKQNPNRALNRFVSAVLKKTDLLNALALPYLEKVAADMNGGKAAGNGHNSGDTRTAAASPVAKFPPPRKRTESEKAMARKAWSDSAQAMASIYDRQIAGMAIGSIKQRELRALAADTARAASMGLLKNLGEVENAILLKKIACYATVVDDGTEVKDIVSVAELNRLANEAHREAPRFLKVLMHEVANRIETQPAQKAIA